MNKKALLACLMAVMVLLSGCSLIVKDAEVDAATEIVRVGDTIYTKADVQNMVDNYLVSQKNNFAQNYGYNLDIADPAIVSDAQDYVMNTLVAMAVVEAKEAEYGVNTLSEEAQAKVDATWNDAMDFVKSIYLSNSELEGEELENQAALYVTAALGMSKEALEAAEKEAALKALVVADVTTTEEEVQNAFDAKVEEAKETYASNLSAYGTAVNNGDTVYYRPAGYRMVKSILLKFGEEDVAAMQALNSKASAQKSAASAKLDEIKAMEAAADVNVDELAAQVEVTVVRPQAEAPVATATDLTATPTDLVEETAEEQSAEIVLTTVITDTLPADLDAALAQAVREYKEALALQTAYEELAAEALETAYANLDAEADDILAQLDAGADWNAMQAEKTQDDGMKTGATAENGYAVCEGFASFDKDYVAAAMALENVGDHSGKVRSDAFGYFILNYASAVEEGAVELALVQETVQEEVLTTNQDNYFSEMVDKWVAESGAKLDKKALNN